MQVGTGAEADALLVAEGERGVPFAARFFDGPDRGGADAAEDLVSGLDLRGDRGLVFVEGVIVAQDRRGDDRRLREIMRGHAQLTERAEHAVGRDAAQRAAADLRAAWQQSAVERSGDQIADVYVPGAGADLNRVFFADVELRDEHVVGVRVLFQRLDPADNNVADRLGEVARDLDLGAGDAHRLGKGMVVHLIERQIDKFIEPFSR